MSITITVKYKVGGGLIYSVGLLAYSMRNHTDDTQHTLDACLARGAGGMQRMTLGKILMENYEAVKFMVTATASTPWISPCVVVVS